MKYLIALVASFVLISSLCAFTADLTSIATANAEPYRSAPPTLPKETKVSITGKVKEVSDTIITVERTVKGNTETMQFVLGKPLEEINVGDKVRVSYIKQDDKLVAIRVSCAVTKKIIKKASPFKETKPSSTGTPPFLK